MFETLRATPTIAVSDIERAKKFYGETLGLKVNDERADGVRYEAGGGSLVLVYPSQFAGTAKSTYMGFDVEDVEKAVRELRERGVVFEEYDMPGERSAAGAITAMGAKAAWFKDSEGNILAIVQDVRR